MKIPIKISKSMSVNGIWTGSHERTLLRVAKSFREERNLIIGEFLSLKTRTNDTVTLQIETAYEDDVQADSDCAYVTEEVFDLIKIDNNNNQKVLPVDGITLGCDPEFFLINNANYVINANMFFKKWGDVGHDGLLMEIRPTPSTDENVVVNNMYNLLLKTRQEINKKHKDDIKMLAFSHYMGLSAGFHLHYGLPKEILGKGNIKNMVISQVVKALDYYIGFPSIIPEGNEDSIRRSAPHIEYGKPGNYRLDNHTLEYRVPGGHLLRHPILTLGLLGLGAIVVEDIISRIKLCTDSFTNLENMTSTKDLNELYPNIPIMTEIFNVICCKSVTPALSYIDDIINDVRNMINFDKRKNSIEPFFDYILSNKQFNSNIENNWRSFYYEIQQRQMGIF